MVDIHITETNTMTLLNIPGIKDIDENSESIKAAKDYDELLKNKVGSDSYNDRPAQTFNLAQKAKLVNPERLLLMKDVNVQANTYEIDDESKMKRVKTPERMR